MDKFMDIYLSLLVGIAVLLSIVFLIYFIAFLIEAPFIILIMVGLVFIGMFTRHLLE